MVKPNKEQEQGLERLRSFVLEVMSVMPMWSEEQLTQLTEIKLGLLRRNATQRHGVTRWKRGITSPQGPDDVEVIDLHPRLLDEEWQAYGAWVLHHEFIHALGHLPHDSHFREFERMWPSQAAGEMGPSFTEHLRLSKARFLWVCPSCSKEHPRQRPGNGRYQCRKCREPLIDVPVEAAE